MAPRLQRRQLRAAGRRNKPQVQHATLRIPLPVQPTAAECAALLKTLVKHLLFQRAQIPYLYDELLKAARQQQQTAAEEEQAAAAGGRKRRRPRPARSDKRLLKFLEKAEELMAAIDAALLNCGVPARCWVLLGSSTAKPREAYEIMLPVEPAGGPAAVQAHPPPAAQAAPQLQAPHEAGAPQQQQPPAGRPRLPRQERLCLLALRQLVAAGSEAPEGTAHTVPCKLFLLLEGPPTASSDTAAAAASTAAPVQRFAAAQQQQQQLALPPPPPGFTVKRQFKLSMRKGVHLKLLLGRHPEEQQQAEPRPDAAAAAANEGSTAGESSSGGNGGGNGPTCSIDAEQQAGTGAAPSQHLSQLPDAAPIHPEEQQGRQQGGGVASSTAGHVWYMCRTVLKGMNQGSQGDGGGAEYDGL